MTDAEMKAIEQENLENVRNALKTITSGNIYDSNGQLNAEGYAALRELDGLSLYWICDPCIKLVPDRRNDNTYFNDLVECPDCHRRCEWGSMIWLNGHCTCPNCYEQRRRELDQERNKEE